MEELRILILEDSENDFLLAVSELRRAGLQFNAMRIENSIELESALKDFSPDIVFVDYNLPTIDGFTALQMVQFISPITPVIMVTGALDERVAVDVIKAGATDYITKDRLERLAGSVQTALRQKYLTEERQRMFQALKEAYSELDKQVKARTEELALANSALKTSLSERLHLEAELRKREREYRTLIEHSPNIIARFDHNLNPVFVNSAGKKRIEWARFFTGSDISPNKQDITSQIQASLSSCFQSGQEQTLETEIQSEEGSRFFLSQIIPEKDDAGKMVTVIIISNDVTNLKLAERDLLNKNQELTEIRKRLEEFDKLKNEFISIASHELRTPLTSMVAFAQTLRSPDITISDQEKDHFLSIIESEGRRLGVLLGDLLDISKIESGRFDLRFKKLDFTKVLKDTISTMKLPDEVHLNVNIPEKPEIVQADGDRIRQVITNLLDNAAKYGRGEIELSVEQTDGVVRARVHDNGGGISGEELGKIFEKFYRSRSKKKGKGTGLGLAISKGIIEAHGGKIWAESQQGKGSDFYIELPLAKDREDLQ
jgi:signal transduction histidine kinase/DNA-binding response OmpR family regulator